MSETEPPTFSRSDDPFGGRSLAIYFKDTQSFLEERKDQRPDPAVLAQFFSAGGGSRYSMLSELGRGGFATVYLVYDNYLKRSVALKILSQGGKRQRPLERFIEEAQATAQLEHPNIVPLYDVGVMGTTPYYTMKYVRGRSLAAVLTGLRAGDSETQREHTMTRLVQILQLVAMAASYAHDKGIVHRDLKPGNVMLGEFGEVQVMDWGLSRFFAATEGRRGVVGTPVYMSPEQASGHIDSIDPRTDVYALGVMLYEVLTLRRPFEGRDLQRLLEAISNEAPVPPSQVTASRPIPPVLEAAAMRALAKAKDDRFPSARLYYDQLQSWLDDESDRERRRELAARQVALARAEVERYEVFRREVRRLEREARDAGALFRGPEPLKDKADLITAENCAVAARRELARRASGVVTAISEVLGLEPGNSQARKLMADYCWGRFEEAEKVGQADDREYYAELTARFDDGRYRPRLTEDGHLWIDTTPTDAEAILLRYVEEGFTMQPVQGNRIGHTPLVAVAAAPGSYLLILRSGGREVRYPMHLARGGEWKGQVRLDIAPPPGFVRVAAGPFSCGPPPGVTTILPDFAIGRAPVTFREYLEFLNELALADPADAAARAPRMAPGEASFLSYSDGRYTLGALAPHAVAWSPSWPIFGVSWHDARAYIRWRSRRDEQVYDLPSSVEWEKAARGVDGRIYPWGSRFDPALTNMKRSLDPPPRPVSVTSLPLDASPYGAQGMGGNVRDWCSEPSEDGDDTRDERVVRGGAWSLGASCVAATTAGGLPASATSPHVGFRLVWRPED